MVEDLVEVLGIKGIETSVLVKTLNGESKIKLTLVDGLVVSNLSDQQLQITLPHCYTKKELPVDPEEIPTPDKLRRWHYLQAIASEIMQNPSVHVIVQIGANCLQAVEPTQIIKSEAGGPYTYKTKLGWCIVGPIGQKNDNRSLKCNKIAVKEVISNNVASHHFEIQNKIKDVGTEDMFQRMHSQEFNEGLFPPSRSQGGEISISSEDKRFLSLMDESAKRIGDHYELPLSFRNDPKVPNNRYQALQRLKHLKNKPERNPTFFGHYKEFMDTLFQRGIVRRGVQSPT